MQQSSDSLSYSQVSAGRTCSRAKPISVSSVLRKRQRHDSGATFSIIQWDSAAASCGLVGVWHEWRLAQPAGTQSYFLVSLFSPDEGDATVGLRLWFVVSQPLKLQCPAFYSFKLAVEIFSNMHFILERCCRSLLWLRPAWQQWGSLLQPIRWSELFLLVQHLSVLQFIIIIMLLLFSRVKLSTCSSKYFTNKSSTCLHRSICDTSDKTVH